MVGSLFVAAVKKFFSSGCLLKQLDATALALVPKVPQPTKVTDYKPIVCCNTVYKCISKIIANGLKVHLPYLVSRNQSDFIYGRRIMDNTLLAQEIIKDCVFPPHLSAGFMHASLLLFFHCVLMGTWRVLYKVLRV